jgi:uncharacterized protein YjiS (DUF1127 family)
MAVNEISPLGSCPHRAPRPGGVARLRGLLAIWRDRTRLRRALRRMLVRTPHLIDDIGLTRPQAEAEAAKRFWQA